MVSEMRLINKLICLQHIFDTNVRNDISTFYFDRGGGGGVIPMQKRRGFCPGGGCPRGFVLRGFCPTFNNLFSSEFLTIFLVAIRQQIIFYV